MPPPTSLDGQLAVLTQPDPPLFVEQAQKNKRRGKKVAKILAEFDADDLAEIAAEAVEDVDFGWLVECRCGRIVGLPLPESDAAGVVA